MLERSPDHGNDFEVALVNPTNPRAGVHLTQHQIFGACGLRVVAYKRNRFSNDRAIGVKNCLRVTVTVRRGVNEYGSADAEAEHVTMEIERESLLSLHAVLAGLKQEFVLRVPRREQAVKQLTAKYQPASESPFYIGLAEGHNKKFGTGFGFHDSWAFQMVIARLLSELFPSLPADFLFSEHLRLASVQASGRSPAPPSPGQQQQSAGERNAGPP